MLSIQTNVNSMNAQENLRVTNQFQGRTIARLTSGYRINESGDDAAGLAVANMYRSDVSELMQGVRNANDGLSTLQIIDGGLNNISKMLDRMKTLATQSASETFTGDRSTLNKEYGDLLKEIDRQAGMVGLGVGTTKGRNNTTIDVYVGGSKQGDAKVAIELEGNANRVDSTGLSLTGTSIASGGATAIGSADIRPGNLLDNAAGSQTFTFEIGKGGQSPYSIQAVVTGKTGGISADEALSQLNGALNSHGISASLSTSGVLQFSGDVAFKATSSAVSGGGTAVAAASTTIFNNSQNLVNGQGTFATNATADVTIKVGTQQVSVTLGAGATTAQLAADRINTVSKALGVYAFANGTQVSFQSAGAFSVTEAGGTAADGVFGLAAEGTAQNSATGTTTGTTTSAAEAAITAVQSAVSKLGLVQGKVGTAQNKLSYAISLAQSQITSFSAAESRIRDADVAQEAANLTKAQVLQQASLAALAQANSAPQAVLSLLRG